MKSNIPYTMVGGHRFYDRKETRDILAYLGLAANPDDSISSERIINEPKRGIGKNSIEELRPFADTYGWALLEAAQNVGLTNTPGKAGKELGNFGMMIQDLAKTTPCLATTELVGEILQRSGYRGALVVQNNLESQARLENLDEFLSVTQKFDKCFETQNNDDPNGEEAKSADLLTDLVLAPDSDNLEEGSSQVTLITLHAAKRLEFPVVFLMGLEEGVFPLSRATPEESGLEEGWRSVCVGITRIEEALSLADVYSRALYGRTQCNRPSRFLEEVEAERLVK